MHSAPVLFIPAAARMSDPDGNEIAEKKKPSAITPIEGGKGDTGAEMRGFDSPGYPCRSNNTTEVNMGFPPVDPAIRGRTVSLILDENWSVLAVCVMLGLGPTSVRRWVEIERKSRASRRLTPDQIASYKAELATLRERVAALEVQRAALIEQLSYPVKPVLG